MTDCTCPSCKHLIPYEYLTPIFWDAVSDSFNGSYFDTECPTCNHPIAIEVNSIPVFSVIPEHQPSAQEKKQ